MFWYWVILGTSLGANIVFIISTVKTFKEFDRLLTVNEQAEEMEKLNKQIEKMISDHRFHEGPERWV